MRIALSILAFVCSTAAAEPKELTPRRALVTTRQLAKTPNTKAKPSTRMYRVRLSPLRLPSPY